MVELLLETRHPFTITTKSDRVLRDLDLLKQAADLRIASVAISVTSLDPKVARTLEPRAPQPRKRLAAMKALNEAGVPCYVAIAPVVPQITDHELEHIVEAVMPDARVRRLLKMAEGEPCLRLRRRTWSGPQIVSAARLVYPGHAHRFATRFSYRADGTSKRSFI